MDFYDRFFAKLEEMQKKTNPCRWRFENGMYVCLRRLQQCCGTGETCRWLGESGCQVKSLSCKLWLCASAVRGLENRRRGGTRAEKRSAKKYLAMRRRISRYCQVLNIPLKIRAAKQDAFDPEAPEALIDISRPDWMDHPVFIRN